MTPLDPGLGTSFRRRFLGGTIFPCEDSEGSDREEVNDPDLPWLGEDGSGATNRLLPGSGLDSINCGKGVISLPLGDVRGSSKPLSLALPPSAVVVPDSRLRCDDDS